MSAAGRSGYSSLAIFLHWLIALMLIGNFTGGLLMEGLFASPDPTQRQLGFTVAQLHKSMGLTILALSLLRLAARFTQGVPPLPGHMTSFERLLARVTHVGLYAVMILVPLSGWVMVSASPLGLPTMWFGLFEWPHLPFATSRETSGAASEAHEIMAFLGVALFLLHVGGALKHHFFDKDDVLARMLPFLRRGTR